MNKIINRIKFYIKDIDISYIDEHAAGCAYYTILAFIPLLLLILTLTKYFGIDEKDVKEEWENPYYGFPQMIRFAFNPNDSTRKKLAELGNLGVKHTLSALLKPLSVKKTEDNLHKKFKYEQEILDLLQVIDGSKDDEELLGFLNYDKIKDGNMCRHIVIVLPYCASCDALEALIKNNTEKFLTLMPHKNGTDGFFIALFERKE